MEAAELQQKLKEGIHAVRSGDRARGRQLLLQVVEADDRVEPAWLWLSAAVDDPADKLVALENVLTLNPNNAQAQTQAHELRRQLGMAVAAPIRESPRAAAPPPGRESPPPASPAPIPGTAVDLDDDPYQCAYCGRLTRDTDNSCPHCGRNLLVWGKWGSGGYQYAMLILCGLSLQLSFVQTIGPAVAIAIAQGINPSTVDAFYGPAVAAFLGAFRSWDGGLAAIILTAAVLRCALWLGITFMFYNDMESAFAVALGVVLLDAGWAGLGAFGLRFLGTWAAFVSWGLGALIALGSVPAVVSRSQARVRLRVELDRDALSVSVLYARGRKYQQKGQWALAALHWRRAAVLNPREPLFYKALGLAQMRLGRHAKARATLEEGAGRAPQDEEFQTLIKAARAKAEKQS